MLADTTLVYIHLLNEGTDVWRPTQGIALGEDIYEILPTPEYDSDDENWEFPPGSLVKCVKQTKDDHQILVATSLATTN